MAVQRCPAFRNAPASTFIGRSLFSAWVLAKILHKQQYSQAWSSSTHQATLCIDVERHQSASMLTLPFLQGARARRPG